MAPGFTHRGSTAKPGMEPRSLDSQFPALSAREQARVHHGSDGLNLMVRKDTQCSPSVVSLVGECSNYKFLELHRGNQTPDPSFPSSQHDASVSQASLPFPQCCSGFMPPGEPETDSSSSAATE